MIRWHSKAGHTTEANQELQELHPEADLTDQLYVNFLDSLSFYRIVPEGIGQLRM